MRILLTTRGSSGHVLPLAPLGHAARRAGHEALVAAQAQHRASVERVGLDCATFDDPPASEWMPLLSRFGELGVEAANAAMVGEFFARIDLRSALPGLRALVERWQPDVIVRDSWEFASALVAEERGIPVVRVGLGLAATEESSIALAAHNVDAVRAELGLPADPAGDRLRAAPYFTVVPELLEDPEAPAPERMRRFRLAEDPQPTPSLPAWWPGNDDPLVYLTLGSVTAGRHLPYFPSLYRAAIDTLAPLAIRMLLTIGDAGEAAELGPLPANVHVEQWTSQEAVLPHAAAVVCHGGYGSTLGALRHGVPLVVLPLFSADQWTNAAAVARAGAGIALDADRSTRRVLDPPGEGTIAGLRPAVERVLADSAYRRGARAIADAMQALAPVDAATGLLEDLTRHAIPGS